MACGEVSHDCDEFSFSYKQKRASDCLSVLLSFCAMTFADIVVFYWDKLLSFCDNVTGETCLEGNPFFCRHAKRCVLLIYKRKTTWMTLVMKNLNSLKTVILPTNVYALALTSKNNPQSILSRCFVFVSCIESNVLRKYILQSSRYVINQHARFPRPNKTITWIHEWNFSLLTPIANRSKYFVINSSFVSHQLFSHRLSAVF